MTMLKYNIMKVGGATLTDHPEFSPGHMFISAIPNMTDQARFAARTDAHSYRKFYVGAAAFAYNLETQETGINAAGNLKSGRGKTKICAERKVLEQSKKAGFTVVAGLVIAATTDIEKIKEVTGVSTATLHPCHECQSFCEEHPLIRDDTVIVTTGLDSDKYQAHTYKELRDLYRANDPELLEGEPHAFGFDNWERRIETYDYLAMAERQLPIAEQRSAGKLIQMALLAA